MLAEIVRSKSLYKLNTMYDLAVDDMTSLINLHPLAEILFYGFDTSSEDCIALTLYP